MVGYGWVWLGEVGIKIVINKGQYMFNKITRGPTDAIFSKVIREANDWYCAKCDKRYLGDHKRFLHCSHFYSRRNRVIRWHPMNVAAHCVGCHKKLSENPIEFTAWIRRYIGEDNLYSLIHLRNMVYKITKAEEKLILAHYQTEYKRLLKMRDEGVTGPIVVNSYFDTVM